jgi:hypothetical protein
LLEKTDVYEDVISVLVLFFEWKLGGTGDQEVKGKQKATVELGMGPDSDLE